MSIKIPAHYRLVYSGEQIGERTEELAAEVREWAAQPADQQLLAVCILRGAVYFFADLLRALNVSAEHEFCRSWGYCTETNTANHDAMRFDYMNLKPKGRKILLVDELCETGETFKRMKEYCLKEGALECKSVSLVIRDIPGQVFKPDWVGFKLQSTDWLVGLGMDDKDWNRNLPDIYRMVK